MTRISKQEKLDRGIGQFVDYDKQGRIPPSKFRFGNVRHKKLVKLSDGKTIICIAPGKNITKIKSKYEKHINSLR